MADCRVVTGEFVTECNPYGKRLHYIKEVQYNLDRKKLIIVKTLPKLKKKQHLKVISSNDILKTYLKNKLKIASNDTKEKSSQIQTIEYPVHLKNKKEEIISVYRVKKGDSLSKIAHKLNLKIDTLTTLNGIQKYTILHIGQKLKVPYAQRVLDALLSGYYTVTKGDTLLSIAKMFHLSPKDIVLFNAIKDAITIREGKVLKLPLPYILQRQEVKQQQEDSIGLGNNLNINAFGTHKLRVTATAYASYNNQTDATPFLAAWNNHIRPGMKIIAVSRDLLTRYGMRNGTKIRIGGLRGFYRVRDKMNKRYRKRIDIYMGIDLKKALRWGKRSVVIYW
jgi:LysM repeat protein